LRPRESRSLGRFDGAFHQVPSGIVISNGSPASARTTPHRYRQAASRRDRPQKNRLDLADPQPKGLARYKTPSSSAVGSVSHTVIALDAGDPELRAAARNGRFAA
jgi:hypothetical protein